MQNDINKPKLKYPPEIIKINDNNYISIAEYEKRNSTFYDVIFNNNGKEIFIGRYIKDFDIVKVMYKDGKILVYIDKYIKEKKGLYITDIYTLYDILDDVHYNESKEEMLRIFDPSLSDEFLINKNKILQRSDIEKKVLNKKNKIK